MNKALYSGKKIKQPTMSAEDFAELSRLEKALVQKIDQLEAVSQSRHDKIFANCDSIVHCDIFIFIFCDRFSAQGRNRGTNILLFTCNCFVVLSI